MPQPAPTNQSVTAQRDFSAGEVDPELKRDDDRPEFKAGLRQCANFRILNSRKLANRSGRRALFSENDRVEEILMAPGVTYYLVFAGGAGGGFPGGSSGFLRVYNAAGTQVFSESRPWDTTTAKDVVWAVIDKSIYITFAGMVPRVLTWDGATTWTAADFSELAISNQKRTPFYRLAPPGITMQPSAATGNITLTLSQSHWTPGHVGTRVRFCSRQILITGFVSGLVVNATVQEPLPGAQQIGFASNDPATVFSLGDVVQGVTSGARGIVAVVNPGLPGSIGVQLITLPTTTTQTGFVGRVSIEESNRLASGVYAFIAGEVVVGPGGSLVPSAVNAITTPDPVSVWDEQVMDSYHGWPASCFSDQGRLGLCNFPAVPSGIAWSAFGVPSDLYVGALPNEAMFEIAPNKSQVLYVVPGMDSSEFVFCDNRLYYIQITPQNPLKPGSVGFNTLSEDECGAVQPRRAGEFILYVTGGLNQVMALRIYGAYTRAYRTESVTELSAHLFTSIKAIAIMTASASFAERYAFVLNHDGSVIAGKYDYDKNAQLNSSIGWTPWTGNGTVSWVSCKGGNTLFTSSYATAASPVPGGPGPAQLVEVLDDSRYLDASQLYTAQPSGLPIPVGKGPLWYLANGSVTLMDGPLGTRMMGTYQVDANGFLVPQNNAGEDFTSPNLVAGQPWTALIEPFIPAVQPGQDVAQRMWKRRITRFQVYVTNSTGFLMARLFAGPLTPTSPALGTTMNSRRIEAWNQDDDATQPPPLREDSYLERPLGRSHDPRMAVIKDTPGPLTVLEIGCEVTV